MKYFAMEEGMKNLIKIVCIAGIMLTPAVLFAGGGNQQSGGAGKLAEIRLMVWDRGTTPAAQGTIEDNWWIRYVNENVAPLGAKVVVTAIPRAQEAQLLSTMLAAGNAPDLSRTNEIPLIKAYISGGGVADILPLVNQHGADIKSLYGNLLDDLILDGKLYYLPDLENQLSRTTWIRKDWLDAAGLKSPSTAEEFYQVLKTIKQRDPGKKGQALIPLAMAGELFACWDNVVLPGFVKTPPAGERFLVPFPMWPETKDAFRWLNKLHAEGLLTDEFILDKDESLIRQRIARGDIFAFIYFGHYPYHSAYGGLYDKIREHSPNAVLANIDTFLQAPGGRRMVFWTSNPNYGYRFFIPATSRNVETAVKVLNWMSTSAGYLTAGLGIEGRDYRLVNGVPAAIDQKAYLERVPWIEPQYGVMSKPFARDRNKFLENYIKDFNPVYFDQIRREAKLLSEDPYYPPTVSLPTPLADKLTPTVTSFWNGEIAKIITASPAQFDQVFDAALKEYRQLGGDQIAAEAQQLYARQQKK
jgi:putative aldouronate transport system substrate-binding protein